MDEGASPGWWATRHRAVRADLDHRLDDACEKHTWVDHLTRAVRRYRERDVEYPALIVVYRGLFLAISMMLVLLYVLGFITDLLPGTNEITIPFTSLPAEQDLGAIVERTLAEFRGAVLGVVGIATLILSATYTAKALRQGSEKVLRPERGIRVRTWHPSNLIAGLVLAVVVLVSWLIALTTAIRTAAISEMAGAQVSRPLVNVGKGVTIMVAEVLLTVAVFVPMQRMSEGRRKRSVLLASAVFAAFLVGANFVLLYAYIVALVDPASSGGVVLVLTILAWVNVVSRGLFFTECWIAEIATPPTQQHPVLA